MSLNHLQVALHIFHHSSNDEQTIAKVSENQVILSTIPNAPIFPFSHVFDMNTQNHVLFESNAHEIVNELIQGNDACIAIYDASSRNRFDTNIMLAFEALFQLKKCEISIQFIEADGYGTVQDLIAREDDEGREYKVDNIEIVGEYYKFGVDHHTGGSTSLFSIILRQKHCISRLSILDLSGCSHDTLDSFADLCINRYHNNNKNMSVNKNLSSVFSFIEKASTLLIIASVNHSDPIAQLENALSYVSNIFENTSYGTENVKKSASLKHRSSQNDDTEYLRRIILKLTNEVNTLRYTRASVNTVASTTNMSENNEPRHASMFSSVSNSTSMTVPDPIYEEKVAISDLERQIEELENQISVTRERNTHVERELQQRIASQDHLFSIQEKQDCIIEKLEWKLDEMERLNDNLYQKLLMETKNNNHTKEQIGREINDVQRDMHHLKSQRNQLDGVLCVMENMIYKTDKDTSNALQELAALKMLSHQQDENLKLKDEEIESLSYQLYHNNMNTQRKLIKSFDPNDSANSSDILHPNNRALESRIEELDEVIELIRNQRDKYSDQLEERTDEYEKLKESHTMQTAKITASEKKNHELEEELKSIYQMMRNNDFSGFVKKLEDEVAVLQQEKMADHKDFEIVVSEMENMSSRMHKQLNDIERLESTVGKLNQQLDETTSCYIQKEEDLLDLQDQLETEKKSNQLYYQKELERKVSVTLSQRSNSLSKSLQERSDSTLHTANDLPNQTELSNWLYERINDPNGGRAEVIGKFVQIYNENYQRTMCMDDLENQILELRYQLALTSYESAKPSSSSLSLNSSRRKTKTGSVGSYSLVYKNPPIPKDRESVQSDASGLRWIPSRQSGSTTPSFPPPGEPPRNPIPPVPMLSYIPNSNSTCPSPAAQQLLSSSNDLVRRDSQTSEHTADSVAPIDHYDHRPRSHRLKSHVPGSQTSNEAVDISFQYNALQAKIKEQQHEIESLLNEKAGLETLKNQMSMQALELKNEKALKMKAEKALYILERRIEELMNTKKNKFRCF